MFFTFCSFFLSSLLTFQLNSFVRDFTLSDLLDKSWSQVSSLLPPGTCITFVLHRAQYSHFLAFHARRFSTNLPPHALALSSERFAQEKVSTKTSMQSGGFTPAILTLVGTRVTHYSTGGACYLTHLPIHLMYIHRNNPCPCLCLLLIERRALLLLWPQTTRQRYTLFQIQQGDLAMHCQPR